jgi:hypothetical protein
MTRKQLRRSAFAALAAGLLCAPAEAATGLFRAYLSSTGNDLNACALASPCRLLPAALAAVADGGEIWMLDSANYNTAQVEVTKSVTILAIPGALGSVLATGGGSALNINTASVKVALRNLVIVQFGSGTYGVTFVQGGELTMTGCEVANVGTGVYAIAPNSKVSIKDSVLRDSNTGVYVGSTTIATIDRTRIENNLTYGINIGNLARLTASNSFVTGNSTGMYLYAGGGSNSQSQIAQTVVSSNGTGIYVEALVGGDAAQATLTQSVVSNNNIGIKLSQGSGAIAQIIVDGSTINHNQQGIQFLSSGGVPTAFSRGNNSVRFNVLDFTGTGSAFTALAAQ